MRIFLLASSSVLLYLSTGCISTGSSVNLTQMEVAIGAAATLGHSGTLAMNAMAQTTACTQVTQRCTTYPCSGAVTITLGPSCPEPLGGSATGTVNVTGMWTSATAASLSTTNVNVTVAGGRNTVVTGSTSVNATPTSIMYTGQNVNVQGSSALAAQSTWNVSVDAMKRYTITGVQQAGSGAGAAMQLDVNNVVLDPACTLNPVSGDATIQDVSGGLIPSVSTAHVTFHSACDGKAEADGSPVTVDFLAH